MNLDDAEDAGAPSSVGEVPAEPIKDLPYIDFGGGPTKELPYTHGIIQGIRRLKHGLLPVAEKMEAGLESAVYGKDYSQAEKEALDRLASAREDTGLIGSGVELAGSILSPINKLIPGAAFSNVAGKGVGNILLNTAKQGAAGAVVGGAQGALNYAGETANKDMNWSDAGGQAGMGAAIGGGVGGLAGGALAKLNQIKPAIYTKSIASTAGDTRIPGKAAGLTSRTAELNKVAQLGKQGARRGYTGGFGQGVEQTLEKTIGASDYHGKLGQQIREKLVEVANAKGSPPIGKAHDVTLKIIGDVEQQLGPRLSPAEWEALAEAKNFLKSTLSDVNAKGRVNKNTPVTMESLHTSYQKLTRQLRNQRKEKDFAGSAQGQTLYKVERAMKDLFREYAKKVDPKLAQRLKSADREYHIAQSIETLAARGTQGERGQRGWRGLAGKVGGIATGMLGKTLGAPGVWLGNYAGQKGMQRTVAANTALNMLKKARRLKGTTRVLAGAATGAPASDSGEY
jgi:hypothetical protein